MLRGRQVARDRSPSRQSATRRPSRWGRSAPASTASSCGRGPARSRIGKVSVLAGDVAPARSPRRRSSTAPAAPTNMTATAAVADQRPPRLDRPVDQRDQLPDRAGRRRQLHHRPHRVRASGRTRPASPTRRSRRDDLLLPDGGPERDASSRRSPARSPSRPRPSPSARDRPARPPTSTTSTSPARASPGPTRPSTSTGRTSRPTGIAATTYSARWIGQVQTVEGGSYAFRTYSDDGVRLWVNGKLVVNAWTDHAGRYDTSAAVTLAAGTKYDVRMEFYNDLGGAVARLEWKRPGTTGFATVPSAQLTPMAGGPVLFADSFDTGLSTVDGRCRARGRPRRRWPTAAAGYASTGTSPERVSLAGNAVGPTTRCAAWVNLTNLNGGLEPARPGGGLDALLPPVDPAGRERPAGLVPDEARRRLRGRLWAAGR